MTGKRLRVGILLRDNALAMRIAAACRESGAEPVWAASLHDLPLDVDRLISTRSEISGGSIGVPVYFVEDYGSVECLVLNLLAPPPPTAGRRVVAVAVDTGKRVGAAYVVDGYVVKVVRYGGLEAFMEDCVRVLECLGAERDLRFYIGYRPDELVHSLTRVIKKRYPGAKVTLVPEEASGLTLSGYEADELSALEIYFKAISEEFQAQG